MVALFPDMNSSSSSSTSTQVAPCPSSSLSSPDISSRSPKYNNHNGKSSERIFRRKWIAEKWLIWITFLVTSILLDSAYGNVMCYECAWQGSSSLPSTADGISDVCRPHNFNVGVVHKIKCPNGCKKQALYEFENDPAGAQRVGEGGTNANNTNASRTFLENMTFYVRGCQSDKKTRESCENKSYNNQVYALECICLTDYCNGERSSGASSTSVKFFDGLFTREGRNVPGSLAQVSRNIVELSVFSFILHYLVVKLFPAICKEAQ